MAAAEKYDIVVKGFSGNPGKGLGDCPFCHRALLSLEVKGIPYTKTFVDFENKPEWLQQTSGGKVPVLRQESTGFVMPESDAIVHYLEEKYPQPSMLNGAYMDQHPPTVGAQLFPTFRKYLLSDKGSSEEAGLKADMDRELKAVNDALSKPGVGPLFGGDNLNVLDGGIAPRLYHVEVALEHFKGYKIPDELSAVKSYMAAIKATPAWKATDYGKEAIIAGWTKHMAK